MACAFLCFNKSRGPSLFGAPIPLPADTQKEAFVACQEDAKAECDKEGAIRELARQNAENAVEALIVPFITQVDDEFTLEMK